MTQLSTVEDTAISTGCYWASYLSEDGQVAAFDNIIASISGHSEELKQLTREQKLAFIQRGFTDPQGAVDDATIAVFDNTILKQHPELRQALAAIPRDKKLALAEQQEPQRTQNITVALFDAQVMIAANPKTEQERNELAANLRLLTAEQKLKIIAESNNDPAIIERKLKLAIFDAAVLKDHPEMKDKLALISDDDKIKLSGEAEPQRTEDVTIALFEASMQDMYAQHPDLKAKIAMIPRDKKLQLIGAVQEGLKQDPQLLEHISQAMQDHPQAFDTAITSLIENPEKKNQLLGLIAADQMQHKAVNMFGGPDSAFGKVINWVFNFLIDGPLGNFLLGVFGGFMGGMSGLHASASARLSDGRPSLQGVSGNFEIAHTIVHGSVENAATGKIYHLDGELTPEEKRELDQTPDVTYKFDPSLRQTTVSSANRSWSLAAVP